MTSRPDPAGSSHRVGAEAQREDGSLSQMVRACIQGPVRRLAVGVAGPGWEERHYADADGETKFEIGSITKGLTGLLLGDAVRRGELVLTEPISGALPQLSATPAGTVTLGELATHRSGLPRLPKTLPMAGRALSFAFAGQNPYAGISREDVVALAARAKLQQRGQFRYSNFGAALVGAVLEEATGRDYAGLLESRLFAPLGMVHSSVQNRSREVAPGRSMRGRRPQPWVQDGFAPAGGVVSTLDDLMRLVAAMPTTALPGAARVFGAEDPQAITLFWMVSGQRADGTRCVWHNGQTGGYVSILALWPEQGVGMAAVRSVSRAAELDRLMRAVGRRGRRPGAQGHGPGG